MVKGKIIILNGVSSSGKTTLAKALQNKLSVPYFNMDVDVFCLMAPEAFTKDDNTLQWEFTSNMFQVVKLYSDMGYNLIVPCVFWYDELLEKCVSLLHSYPVMFVHVKCPVNELQRREEERGDRPKGLAEFLINQIIPKDTYDITLDTLNNSTDECVDQIIMLLDYPDKLTAFASLWSQHAK